MWLLSSYLRGRAATGAAPNKGGFTAVPAAATAATAGCCRVRGPLAVRSLFYCSPPVPVLMGVQGCPMGGPGTPGRTQGVQDHGLSARDGMLWPLGGCYHPYSRDDVIGGASQLVAGGQPGGLHCGHFRGVTCARHAERCTISNSGCEEDLVLLPPTAPHAPLRKLLYAPKWLPELLGVASAACCRRDGTALLIGARASGVLFSSLGTSPAKPRRRAMMGSLSLVTGQASGVCCWPTWSCCASL